MSEKIISKRDLKLKFFMRNYMKNDLPNIGFLRLPQVLELIPVSKSSWWAGCKNGRYPKPIKLSARTTVWRVEDIRELIESFREKKSGAT